MDDHGYYLDAATALNAKLKATHQQLSDNNRTTVAVQDVSDATRATIDSVLAQTQE